MNITINENPVKLSNLEKIFWPKKGITKGDLINYYVEIYPYIKDYLKDRPLSLKIYPDGITGNSFYQKNCPDYAPDWLSTSKINSDKKSINWIMVNNLSDLAWITNHAAIELHGWFSTIKHPDRPDFAVFDLDPGPDSGFRDVVEIALFIKNIMDELNLTAYVKTSGISGLHVFVPLKPVYKYKTIKKFLRIVAEMVIKVMPEKATVEWRKENRKNKVYIDYRQNARGKTIPAPYSLRPTPEAAVSTPLTWSELNTQLQPADFRLKNIKDRLKYGDIWPDLTAINQELPGFLL